VVEIFAFLELEQKLPFSKGLRRNRIYPASLKLPSSLKATPRHAGYTGFY
jgi:hypothetical protein